MTKEELIIYLEELIDLSYDGWNARDICDSLGVIVKEIKEKGITVVK